MPAGVEAQVRAWLAQFVVGLDLCPFARPLLDAANLRIAICADTARDDLARAFLRELDLLQRTTETEIATTLLVLPAALTGFDDYLDYLDEVQALLEAAGLEGLVQLASFHPRYLFEGEDPGAASHFSNRSPYPIIHLLRESMLTRVLAEGRDPKTIPARNIDRLQAIGTAEMERRWRALFAD